MQERRYTFLESSIFCMVIRQIKRLRKCWEACFTRTRIPHMWVEFSFMYVFMYVTPIRLRHIVSCIFIYVCMHACMYVTCMFVCVYVTPIRLAHNWVALSFMYVWTCVWLYRQRSSSQSCVCMYVCIYVTCMHVCVFWYDQMYLRMYKDACIKFDQQQILHKAEPDICTHIQIHKHTCIHTRICAGEP
jgi:hypothetical protein